jgi:uncharacterized protein (TIGR02118 family)
MVGLPTRRGSTVTTKIVALWKKPNDVDGFEKHYADTHMPLVNELPKVKKTVTSKAQGDAYYRMAEIFFDSGDDVGGAMGSDAGAKLMADTGHMQETFGTTVEVLIVDED